MGFNYKILTNQISSTGMFSIVPIRMEDKVDIMKWRNEQIYHLRQSRPLTIEDQDKYFSEVVTKLFEEERPSQILFSYLEHGKCIGYGGLVHVNWIDKNAEISFIVDTRREKNEFHKHWAIYLGLIEKVAFNQLNLHKIYTYAFDLRPHLYEVLENNAYNKEAVLKDHAFFEGKFIDVIIHSKTNLLTRLRPVVKEDLMITYEWAIDQSIRKYALSKHQITFEEHSTWFNSKLKDTNCIFFIAEIDQRPVGSIRFDREGDEAVISYLISPELHGKGLGKRILHEGVKSFFEIDEATVVKGTVLAENVASIRIFESLGYKRTDTDNGMVVYKKYRNS